MLPLTHITVHSPYGWPSEYCCAVTTEWEVGWFPFFKKWGGAWAGVLIWRTTNFWQTNFEPPRAVFSLILRQLYLIPRNHSLSCAICHSHSDLILGFWIDQHKKNKRILGRIMTDSSYLSWKCFCCTCSINPRDWTVLQKCYLPQQGMKFQNILARHFVVRAWFFLLVQDGALCCWCIPYSCGAISG